MVNKPLSDDGLSVRTADPRRDTLPLWVTILLLLFVGRHVYNAVATPARTRQAQTPTAGATTDSKSKSAASDDTDPAQSIVLADVFAKAAFFAAPSRGASVRPDPRLLAMALHSAEALQAGTENAPGAARRVILLRFLLNNSAPLAAGIGRSMNPRAAFGVDLPPQASVADKARYAREGRLWETIFAGGPLSPRQTKAAAMQIQAIPAMRWWAYPALIALYQNQRDLSEANRYAQMARARALPTLLPVFLLLLLRIGLGLGGALLLLYVMLRLLQKRAAAPGTAILPSLWRAQPTAVAASDRRLGVGDLVGIFILYLVSAEALRLLLTGFDGVGARHLFHFRGGLEPFRAGLQSLPPNQRNIAQILIQSAAYLLSAVPPMLALFLLARHRGASLADEIGWHRRRFGGSLAFGLSGYAIGSALMVFVALVAHILFRNEPAPSNPVNSLMINASGFLQTLLLLLLTAVAAPLVEELMFRGVFYNGIKQRVGVWPAIILTGLVFGFVHPVGIAEMCSLATLGGVFAWMAETRQSLVPSIFGHFLQNSISTLLVLLALAG